ncbi:hypothetical protein MLD38_006614 [Melastoma candidum]|nr:hypothetical protein MLD38_006614 [Melastoma candidum]
MSGMVGCIASIKRPDLFKRLFLVGSSPMFRNVDGYEGGFETKAIEQMLTILETNYDEWTSSFANFVVNPKDPSSVDIYMNCLRRMKPEVALPVAKAIFYSDHREMLGKVTTPCTIVQTTKDDVVPNSVPYLMQGWIQGKSTVEMIEMDGHYPQLTAPGKLLDVMGRILGFDHDLLD